MNDPDIEVGSKAFESEMANIGTDLASFFVPYMGTLKLLNGVSFLSKVASKTANHKWNKAFNYSRSAVENILKQKHFEILFENFVFFPFPTFNLTFYKKPVFYRNPTLNLSKTVSKKLKTCTMTHPK